MTIPDIQPLRTALSDIQDAVNTFNQIWPDRFIEGFAFSTEIRSTNTRPDFICVKSLGESLVSDCQEAFANFHYQEHQHPGTVSRTPGVLFVDADLSPHINRINTLKAQLKAMIQAVPTATRAKFTRQALPSVSLLQVYREIAHFSKPTDSVYFSWASHTTTNSRISSLELWDRIEQMSKPDNLTNSEYAALLSHQKAMLSQHSELVIRRVKAPHPRVQFRHTGDTSTAGRIFAANLPIFVPLKHGQTLPHIYSLTSYSHDKQPRKRRSDASDHAPVIPSLNVYTA